MTFDAAPSEEALWGADGYEPPYPAPTDVTLGQVAVGPDGIAELSLTLDTETIGFLHAGTALYLASQYQPYELAGTGTYDQEYAASTSAAAQLVPASTAGSAHHRAGDRTGHGAGCKGHDADGTGNPVLGAGFGAVPGARHARRRVGAGDSRERVDHLYLRRRGQCRGHCGVRPDRPHGVPSLDRSRPDGRGGGVGADAHPDGHAALGRWQAGARYGSVSDGAALEVASGAALLLEASAALPGGREPTGTLRIAVDGTEWPTGVALLEVERRTYAVTVSFDSKDPDIGSVTESFAVVGNPPAAPTATTLEVEPLLVRGEKWVRATVRRSRPPRGAPRRAGCSSPRRDETDECCGNAEQFSKSTMEGRFDSKVNRSVHLEKTCIGT